MLGQGLLYLSDNTFLLFKSLNLNGYFLFIRYSFRGLEGGVATFFGETA